jgi:hypothetical protein
LLSFDARAACPESRCPALKRWAIVIRFNLREQPSVLTLGYHAIVEIKPRKGRKNLHFTREQPSTIHTIALENVGPIFLARRFNSGRASHCDTDRLHFLSH